MNIVPPTESPGKSPRPMPTLNLSTFRTPRKNGPVPNNSNITPRIQTQRPTLPQIPLQPHSQQLNQPSPQKNPRTTSSKSSTLKPMTARPKQPDSIFSDCDEMNNTNPRFHFFIPTTYQTKNLPLRISPIIPNAPISPEEAIEKYYTLLTPFEVTEILEFPEIYFVGFKNKKVNVNLTDSKSFGFDDPLNGFYKAKIGDHIIYRFEIESLIGQGNHGQIFKCFDHKNKENIAVKILANNKRSPSQFKVEMTILSRLKKLHPDSIETAQIYFLFRQHMFVTFNILGKNVAQIMKLNSISALSPRLVRCIAQDVIKQLNEIYQIGVTLHGQICSENILLVPDTNADFKLIDYSNSILEDNIPDDYQLEIPSSFRSPEIILGFPNLKKLNKTLDMWCLGCLLVNLTVGRNVFEAKDDINQLSLMSEVMNIPDAEVVKKAPRRLEFFDKATGQLIKTQLEPQNVSKKEGGTNWRAILGGTNDTNFVDFVAKIFTWDGEKRITVQQALEHPFITDVESRLPELIKQ